MTPVTAIAWNTFLEAIREKVLYMLAGFAGFVFIATRVLAPLALGEGRRVTVDLGMMSVSIFGLLIIVFVGHSLVYRELERGTVSFLFSRPIGRGSYVLGKFSGLALVLFVTVGLMGGVLASVLALSGYSFGWDLFGALFLTLLELWILASLAMLFASLVSPILAGLFVVGAWVIGNSVGSLGELAGLIESEGATVVLRGALWVLPRLDLYDGASWLVHHQDLSRETWAWSIGYACLYITAMLFFARVAFARRPLLG